MAVDATRRQWGPDERVKTSEICLLCLAVLPKGNIMFIEVPPGSRPQRGFDKLLKQEQLPQKSQDLSKA